MTSFQRRLNAKGATSERSKRPLASDPGSHSTALMARAIAHAHELGLDIELSTWAFNEHAHAAFARLGFQRMLVRYQLGTGS